MTLNSIETCITDYLNGVQDTYPGIFIDIETQFIMLNRDRKSRVALLTGGGSGNEPYGAGFVGENMLTGCILGNIFSAPPSSHLVTVLSNLAKLNRGGILVIELNYTADKLRFGMALETVEAALVTDDSGHMDENWMTEMKTGFLGRRGLCGVVLMIKILGAMSAEGRILKELEVVARCINCRMSTLGVAVRPCTMPGGKPLWALEENQAELGVGLHGETGTAFINMCTTEELVRSMLSNIMKIFVKRPGDSVVALVNNLGVCMDLELYNVAHELKRQLVAMKLNIERLYVGQFCSCLNMLGIQICLLNITGRREWVKFLDMETEAFAWPVTALNCPPKYPPRLNNFGLVTPTPELEGLELNKNDSLIFKNCILAVSKALINEENKLNLLDKRGGDGDCGSALSRFAIAIESAADKLPFSNVAMTFLALSEIAARNMGGTAGQLYALMLLGAARNSQQWNMAWVGAIEMVKRYSLAEIGYRTMLDALIPACLAYDASIKEFGEQKWERALRFAVDKAVEGCGDTASMKPRVGKSRFVDPQRIQDVDPGAYGVVVWLDAIKKQLVSQSSSHPSKKE